MFYKHNFCQTGLAVKVFVKSIWIIWSRILMEIWQLLQLISMFDPVLEKYRSFQWARSEKWNSSLPPCSTCLWQRTEVMAVFRNEMSPSSGQVPDCALHNDTLTTVVTALISCGLWRYYTIMYGSGFWPDLELIIAVRNAVISRELHAHTWSVCTQSRYWVREKVTLAC